MNMRYLEHLERVYRTLDELAKLPIERDYPLIWEKAHATSCSNFGRLLALRVGIDTELAAIACLLHDIGRWYSGQQANHAAQGEEPVRRFLKGCGYSFNVEEQIVQAVIHHSDKGILGTDLEEIVKDADILDCYCYGLKFEKLTHVARLERLLKSFGPITPLSKG